MSRELSKRKARCLDEIAELRARRRRDVIKCAAALAIIVVVVAGKQLLASQGVIDPNGIVAGALTMLIAFGLAIVGGTASIEFTKSGAKIRELRQSCGISKEHLKQYRV